MKKVLVLSLCFILNLGIGVVRGADFVIDEAGYDLGQIVVTPTRYTQSIDRLSSSVKIITSQDIKNSNAQTIPEILRSQAGLVVRDYYGNGAKVILGSRGFGETAASNTLVLIDGRRVNEIDLSGVDWTQIQLDNVQRIEVVSGSNSILYGDNAIGGVINVITKEGQGPAAVEFEATAGSYDMNKQRLSLSGSQESWSYFLSATAYSTHGYRVNSGYRSSDFYSKLIYDASDDFSLGFTCGYHEADLGLPGALLGSQLATNSRRDSVFPDDTAGQEDWHVRVNPRVGLFNDSEFELPLSFRRRTTDTEWGTGGYGINSSHIDTIGICPKLVLNSKVYEKDNTFTLGLDFYNVAADLDDFSSAGAKTGDSSVSKKSTGFYLQDEVFLRDDFILNFGYRWDKTKYYFDYVNLLGFYVNVDDESKFDEEFFKVGAVYNYKEDAGRKSKIFFNVSEGLRLPVTEEFMLYNFLSFPFGRNINQNLMPQKSISYEGGLSHYFSPQLSGNLTLFLMKIDDEIYYNPSTFINENYEKTKRQGIELDLDWSAFDDLDIFLNYCFTEAIFDSGAFENNQIPAVPEHRASLGLNYQVALDWKFSAMLNYVGKHYFISDQQHNYPKMKDYTTLDIKMSYDFGESTAFLGINNVFDAEYSEYGAISFSGERGYYPSPGRNFVVGCLLKF